MNSEGKSVVSPLDKLYPIGYIIHVAGSDRDIFVLNIENLPQLNSNYTR